MAIFRVRAYYVDFFVFFVLRHSVGSVTGSYTEDELYFHTIKPRVFEPSIFEPLDYWNHLFASLVKSYEKFPNPLIFRSNFPASISTYLEWSVIDV